MTWKRLEAYIYVLPALLLVSLFIYWPLVFSMFLSTQDWNLVSPRPEFVGIDNFAELARETDFHDVVKNTFFYIAILTPLQVLLPLGIALLMWPIRKSRPYKIYRIILFLPVIVPFSASSVAWLWMYNPTAAGVFNQLLSSLDVTEQTWLRDPDLAVWCIIAISVWRVIGVNFIIYMSALVSVPDDYVEASALDGASALQAMLRIRLPLISPTLFFVLITTVIFVSEEIFTAISILTDGGPFGRTSNVLYFLFERGFRFFRVGEASAIAIFVFVVMVFLTWLQFRYVEKRVHYD
jgi:multiple sugar transport system permease protein/sn-glycerol 3-phosphate transport system permease protein